MGMALFTGGCGKGDVKRAEVVDDLMLLGDSTKASNELGDILDKTGDGCINQADLDAFVAAKIDNDQVTDAWIALYGFKPGLEDVVTAVATAGNRGCVPPAYSANAVVEELIKVGYTPAAANELRESLDKTGDGCLDAADVRALGASAATINNAWIAKYGFKPGLQNVFSSAATKGGAV